jgi:Fe-S-cluster-containing dehydrogenase component
MNDDRTLIEETVESAGHSRRDFMKKSMLALAAVLLPRALVASKSLEGASQLVLGDGYKPGEHYWGMGIDTRKCIGCGRCVDACKTENNVPRDAGHFRTWVERYRITDSGEAVVDSPNGAIDGFRDDPMDQDVVRTFFVPKLCNHCDSPPCVQVCPVGATYKSPDGVVLVDQSYCIGCRYCIQACPYGARFLDPKTHTAQKCTFCYHRISKGMLPACVEVCPTQARVFGEVHKKASPLQRFLRMNRIGVLKPYLNTRPKVYYGNLDGEVD